MEQLRLLKILELMHGWQLFEGLETEVIQKLTRGGIYRRAPRHIALPHHTNPATLAQSTHDRATYRHPTHLFNIATGHWLTISDQRQGLQQSSRVTLWPLIPQPRHPGRQTWTNTQLITRSGLKQLQGALHMPAAHPLQRLAQFVPRRTLMLVEQPLKPLQREWLISSQQRRLKNFIKTVGQPHTPHTGLSSEIRCPSNRLCSSANGLSSSSVSSSNIFTPPASSRGARART